jgi:murein DD-endopeptidase MepM/ murein hydrolase activator NlpD
MLLAATLAVVPLALPLSFARGSAEGMRGPASRVLHLQDVALPQITALPGIHTVVSGDTLWEISREVGTSVAALAVANHMCDEDPLMPGRVLVIPDPGPEPTTSTSSDCALIIVSGTDMSWPSFGRITSGFGWRTHPVLRTRRFHTGIDIASPWNAPVRAARSGIVHFVGWMVGYGQLIIVDHENGLQTIYAHLSKTLVQAGTRVAQGQLIGRVGSTGWSTGPHLFFEIRRYGVPVDPIHLLH